ncbi:hypothetical protein PHYBLDRAFT_169808 [Phycomyces blakesleeanus NRRL 1555(-)]|uniref:Prokaryotic-type class I peptide chain release factors domain-containing protein n=1 Tax=Phycomyces blakesleeanus (strain ATCC 8743b / DSM 1359 / FGSC 10004 / NBRC 33097 / NRRL 1555) TaxID=763407 RepID=A0A162U2S7_PHYB8|nr:hypothetical protein PHYBLDRAFT_169808 [Phycomyces blakesleeanus NRRL 1555(-)]OAD71893.1 hypothetical protein PHYBLDRAFT_169808 [Phycomyces blakesleeanus NRRL 1555(-)]|eukprot:XP_018289933.1 hypothetical protein PHYBLDRAFT_169808 [Phycomyces blakesleeanus NRRL 1555(-)]
MLQRFYSSSSGSIWPYAKATEWIKRLSKATIPPKQLQLSFSRSSGPGGQNVNKGMYENHISTKVTLRLALQSADWIPAYAKDKLASTKTGDLIITSDRTRSQAKNVEDCYDKLLSQLRLAVAVPKEADSETLARVKHLQQLEDTRRKDVKKRQSDKKIKVCFALSLARLTSISPRILKTFYSLNNNCVPTMHGWLVVAKCN